MLRVQVQRDPSGRIALVTHGMGEQGHPELALERLPEMSPAAQAILTRVLLRLAAQAATHKRLVRLVVALGDYGRVVVEAGKNPAGESVLWVRDAHPGAPDAQRFVGRLMALTAFKRMETGDPSVALDCFDLALKLQPKNAMLLQARAWARYGVICRGDGNGAHPGVLSLQVLGDLLQSINLDPERAEVYQDLLSMLRVFRPLEGGDPEDHRQWVAEIVRLALYHPAESPPALAAREALIQFLRENQ
ncbi:MAG: hypothetical protein WCF84_18030 [Anaerolineae bacterium]